MDTTVRNTWELDAGQFIFRNPDWPGFVICLPESPWIREPIAVQIYKMLIYEKGVMTKTHTEYVLPRI